MKSCRCGAIVATTLLATSALAPTAAAVGAVHTVELVGMAFVPADIVVELGDTVHWVWVSGFHNVESGIVVGGSGAYDGLFRSGSPTGSVGTTFDVVFDQALVDANPSPGNVYPYYCVVHAALNMIGSITLMVPGDLDGDGQVGLTDHEILSACLAGPEETLLPVGCASSEFSAADVDGDGDVDLRDFAAFQAAFQEAG